MTKKSTLKSVKKISPGAFFLSIILGVGLSLFLAGCGESPGPQTGGVVGQERDFSTEIPRGLEKNRTGLNLTAELIVDDGTPIPLTVDFANQTVSGTTARNLKPGTHTFKINYFLNELGATTPATRIRVATATTTAEITPGENTPVTFTLSDINQDLDGDGVSGINEVLTGFNPNDSEFSPFLEVEPNNTPASAQIITLLPEIKMVFIGTANEGDLSTTIGVISVEDFYTFTLASPAHVLITLVGTNGRSDFDLHLSDGSTVLLESTNRNNLGETIDTLVQRPSPLAAGRYDIFVNAMGLAEENDYILRVFRQP